MKHSPLGMTRVHWHLGQGLLPEHFYAQEESLRAESALRFELLGAPAWGLGSLDYDTFDLPKGTLSVDAMSLVLESGVVLDVPGNTSRMRLDLTKVGGDRPASVYVHLDSGFEVLRTSPGDPGEEGIERILQKAELSVERGPADRSFKLAEVQCDAEDSWSFCDTYVPPLLCVRQGLFLDGQLTRMKRIVSGLRHVLKEQLQQGHLSGETQLFARQALGAVLHFQASLADVEGELHPHPYHLFRALRALYIDMAVLRDDSQLDRIEEAYDHEDIAGSFQRFLAPLEAMAAGKTSGVPYVELTLENGLYSCALPDHVNRAVDVFLMIQKPRVSATLKLDGIKLSSPNRIQTVYERALSGIRFANVERPPFAQTLSSTVEIFQLSRGEEWDHAVKERKVVLYEDEALANCRLYLYFRMD